MASPEAGHFLQAVQLTFVFMGQPHKLSLAVQYAVTCKNLPDRQQFRRWVRAALQQDLHCTLRVVDEDEGRRLNRDFRGRDYATNVLTFVYDDTKPLSGDIVVCAPVVEREAAAQGKALLAHYAHMTVHSVLHLQGYEHENDRDAAAMEALETAIVAKLGYPVPYEK